MKLILRWGEVLQELVLHWEKSSLMLKISAESLNYLCIF